MPKVLACLPAHRCGPGEVWQWASRGPGPLGTHSLGGRQNHTRQWDKISSRGHKGREGGPCLGSRKTSQGERLEEGLNI